MSEDQKPKTCLGNAQGCSTRCRHSTAECFSSSLMMSAPLHHCRRQQHETNHWSAESEVFMIAHPKHVERGTSTRPTMNCKAYKQQSPIIPSRGPCELRTEEVFRHQSWPVVASALVRSHPPFVSFATSSGSKQVCRSSAAKGRVCFCSSSCPARLGKCRRVGSSLRFRCRPECLWNILPTASLHATMRLLPTNITSPART